MADVPLMSNPMTTQGDIVTGGASGAAGRLGIGTAGQVLTVNAGATAPEWAAASGAGNLQYSQVVRNNVTNLTLNSATWADVDGTNLTITMTTGARRVLLSLRGRISCDTAAKLALFNWSVDGTAVKTETGGTAPLLGGNFLLSQVTGSAVSIPFHLSFVTDALTAASHTFRPRWCRSGVGSETWTMYATSSDYLIFSAQELYAA